MTATPTDLLETCVAAARAAGSILIEGLTRNKDVVQKSERASIVTWADITAQDKIFEIIQARHPGCMILGEEGDAEGDDSLVFIVDPLDGTSNYASGIPFACTSIAVRDSQGLAAGAILNPFANELFTAIRGGGAWLDGTRLAVSTNGDVSRALVATGLQSDDADEIEGHGKRIVALHRSSRGARAFGSPALCLAYVAAGRLDAFFEKDATYAWDIAAGSLMIREAGGQATDLDGHGPINLSTREIANVLGTNGSVHAGLHTLLAATGTL